MAINDGKLARATRLGADAVAAVIRATEGGAHGALITAPFLPAFKQGVSMTRKHGTGVLVGIPPGEF